MGGAIPEVRFILALATISIIVRSNFLRPEQAFGCASSGRNAHGSAPVPMEREHGSQRLGTSELPPSAHGAASATTLRVGHSSDLGCGRRYDHPTH